MKTVFILLFLLVYGGLAYAGSAPSDNYAEREQVRAQRTECYAQVDSGTSNLTHTDCQSKYQYPK